MQIEISDQTVEQLKQRLGAEGIDLDSPNETVNRMLEILALSPRELSINEIMDQLKGGPAEEIDGSALDVAERLGIVGAFEGPADLASNPDHMNGFGR